MVDRNNIAKSAALELKSSAHDGRLANSYKPDNVDNENGANYSKLSIVEKCGEEMPNSMGGVPRLKVKTRHTYENLELLPRNETKGELVIAMEKLEEPKGSIKFEDGANDERDYKNYEKEENSNKEVQEMGINACNLVCPSCSQILPIFGEGVTLKLEKCLHTVCRYCITDLLKSILKDETVEPKCRFRNFSGQCDMLIEEHEIRELVDPDLYEAYLEKSIIKIKEEAGNRIYHCKSPLCKAWYILEDDYANPFFCTLCKIENHVNEEIQPMDIDKLIQTERYNEILLLSESGVVPNFESFECPICFVQCEPREGLILRNCLHTFCKECIANVVLYSEEPDIKCPYKNDDYSCDEEILQSEIRAVVKPDDFQKYLQKSISQVERKSGKSAFHCKTPNCPDWCFVEPGVDNFLCPTCKEDNCFLCEKIHTGKGCYDDASPSKKSDFLIQLMLTKKSAIPCPTCETLIMKVEGCDAVTCASCKTEICWATRGPRWGPGGRGDKSGGCRCEPYARCHPECRNCH